MRVRVKFRYSAATGEVEHFLIEDVGGPREADHDAQHDRIAADVARVVERNALIEEQAGAPVMRAREPVRRDDEHAPTRETEAGSE